MNYLEEHTTGADRHLARHLLALEEQPDDKLEQLIALTSAAIRAGHVCLDLRDDPLLAQLGLDFDPQVLQATYRIVGGPDDGLPLVVEGNRFYIARYHAWERQVRDAIQHLLTADAVEPAVPEQLRAALDAAFPATGENGVNWQKVAAAMALTRRFCIISGGPGTGKTWTLARVLQLLLQFSDRPLRIALAAPTGKAAARMTESIEAADAALLEQVAPAGTLHRFLGMRPGRIQPRHGPGNPLPVDVLIVDEASMIDLPMMARLLAALPSTARLILLGDRYQLASVEAGQVLADLCGDGGMVWSRQRATEIQAISGESLPVSDSPLSPMADHMVMLRHSRRFDPKQGIGRLAAAVNRGDAAQALQALDGDDKQVRQAAPDTGSLKRLIQQHLVPVFASIRAQTNPAMALQQLEQVRLLCAVREGPQGMRHMNYLAEQALGEGEQRFYHGQPVMVTVNDYSQQLFNGDIGLLLRNEAGLLRAWFRDGAGGVRAILPSRLPAHETVYAMTIHKSQGSEFEQVILVLPEEDNPVASRELLYTGITRARQQVILCATSEAITRAIERQVRRSSGLYEALWRNGASP